MEAGALFIPPPAALNTLRKAGKGFCDSIRLNDDKSLFLMFLQSARGIVYEVLNIILV